MKRTLWRGLLYLINYKLLPHINWGSIINTRKHAIWIKIFIFCNKLSFCCCCWIMYFYSVVHKKSTQKISNRQIIWTFSTFIIYLFLATLFSLTTCEIAQNWPHQGHYNIAYTHLHFIVHYVTNIFVMTTKLLMA